MLNMNNPADSTLQNEMVRQSYQHQLLQDNNALKLTLQELTEENQKLSTKSQNLKVSLLTHSRSSVARSRNKSAECRRAD